MIRLKTLITLAGLAFAMTAWPITGKAVPANPSFSANYQLAQAKKEGQLRIYATTDYAEVKPLIRAFTQRYPFIHVQYHELSGQALEEQVLAEFKNQQGRADIAWSSAMDRQVRLVNLGIAKVYASPERHAIPNWAQWRQEVYGTSFEPIVFVSHQQGKAVPISHAALQKQLQKTTTFKMASYHPKQSGTGYLLLTQDTIYNPDFWALQTAIQQNQATWESSSKNSIYRVIRKEADLAYNVIGPYALSLQKSYPELRWQLPLDYTLVLTRLSLIPKTAPHPYSAELWTDFVLSKAGQRILSQHGHFAPIREDLPRQFGPLNLSHAQYESILRPIQVGTGLLTFLDQAKQKKFLKQWQNLANHPR